MNLSETIASLEKLGIVQVEILFANKDHPLAVQAKQVVTTGAAGNHASVHHQVVEPDLVTCFDTLRKRAAHAHDGRSEIIQVPRRN